MVKELENIPVAFRTMQGLSDIGYTFESAVADLIDNSITQGESKNILVAYNRDEEGFYLRILDDGKGMTRDRLFDSMTIGSASADYKRGDLSKYGIGMKSASLSQCKELTVLSKSINSMPTAFSWNMKVVKERGWKVLEFDSDEVINKRQIEIERLTELVGKINLYNSKTWTMVCWDKMIRQENEYNLRKTEQSKENYFAQNISVLIIYLRTVFHRFLEGEGGARQISIYVNGEKLKTFDPFCRDQPNTIEDLFYKNEGSFQPLDDNLPPILIRRYILPTKEGPLGFKNLSDWKIASGYLSWNDAQGYYVYRNNRLIDFGGWFSTKGKDEHDKLARVSIDLSDEHDTYFTLDVTKSKIESFPDQFKIYLKDKVNKDYIQRAKKRYKKAEKKAPPITNKVRSNTTVVSNLSIQLVKLNEIDVVEEVNESETHIIVKNPDGTFTEKELLYRQIDPKFTIISKDFGNDENFWKMVPGPGNYFQVLVNENHPFYEKIYLKASENKVATSAVDSLLYTLAFIELRFKTDKNRMLFYEINDVASDILKKIIEKNLL